MFSTTVKYFAVILSLLLSLAVSSSLSSEEKVTFKFAWQLADVVTVTETIHKKGRTFKIRYRAILDAYDDKHYLFTRDNFYLLEANGKTYDPPDPIGPNNPLAFSIPVIIDKQGYPVAAINVDEILKYFEFYFKNKDKEKNMEIIRALLSKPQLKTALEINMISAWEYWVANYLDIELLPGDILKEEYETDITGIPVLENRTTQIEKSANGYVNVKIDTEISAANMKHAMTKFTQELTSKHPDAKDKGAQMNLKQMHLEKKMSLRSLIDPDTTKPISIARKEVVQASSNGEITTQIEEHLYEFQW